MDLTPEVLELARALYGLTPSQRGWVSAVVEQFKLPHKFERNPNSDWITPKVLESLGDAMRIHHAFSRQPLSKDRFEHAFERSLSANGIQAALVTSRTNRGHDLTISGIPVSLKTEAASNIRESSLHISKFMELGRGEWHLPGLLQLYLEHMNSYERIFQFRCLNQASNNYKYELIEIPKALLLEARNAQLEIKENSRQTPKPGYGYVYDNVGHLKFALYFDGGTERKLQIKSIDKKHCIYHATWDFGSTPLQ